MSQRNGLTDMVWLVYGQNQKIRDKTRDRK